MSDTKLEELKSFYRIKVGKKVYATYDSFHYARHDLADLKAQGRRAKLFVVTHYEEAKEV